MLIILYSIDFYKSKAFYKNIFNPKNNIVNICNKADMAQLGIYLKAPPIEFMKYWTPKLDDAFQKKLCKN